MKFSNPFPPKSEKSLTTRERQNQEVETRINEILFHSMQLQRTLWLTVKANGGVTTIDESATDPLWNLEFHRPSEVNKSLLTISASLLPEATPEQLDKLAAALLGKKDDPSAEIDKVGLGEYPKSYTIKALQSRVIYVVPPGQKESVWMTRAAFDQLPKQEPPPTQPPAQNAV